MLRRVVIVLVGLPVAIVLVVLAVANRTSTPFTLDPFNPGNPGLTVHLPLFIYLFAALALGILVGGIATWIRQGRYRRMARQRPHGAEPLSGPGRGNRDLAVAHDS